jgi:hypothetical protein
MQHSTCTKPAPSFTMLQSIRNLQQQWRPICPQQYDPSPYPLLMLPHTQGYQQLKVMRTGRNVTCFVEFDTVATATACHESQQVGVYGMSGWDGWCVHAIMQQGVLQPTGRHTAAGGGGHLVCAAAPVGCCRVAAVGAARLPRALVRPACCFAASHCPLSSLWCRPLLEGAMCVTLVCHPGVSSCDGCCWLQCGALLMQSCAAASRTA